MKGVNDDGGLIGSWVRFGAIGRIDSMSTRSSSTSHGNYTLVSSGIRYEIFHLTSTSISLSDMAGGRPATVSSLPHFEITCHNHLMPLRHPCQGSSTTKIISPRAPVP